MGKVTNCVTPQNCFAMKIILVKLIFRHNCTVESTVSIWHFLNSSSGNLFSRMFYWRIAIRHPSSVFHPPRSYNTLHRGASGHLSGSKKGHRLMGIRIFFSTARKEPWQMMSVSDISLQINLYWREDVS